MTASGASPAEADVRHRLGQLLRAPVRDVHDLGAAHGVRHARLSMEDGRLLFAKYAAAGTAGADAGGPGAGGNGAGGNGPFEAEARGLAWLAEAAAVPVPEVAGWDETALVIAWVPAGRAGPQAAEQFGRDLAQLHAAGAPAFGAAWPGVIASLPLPNDAGDSWPQWYAEHRLLPYARRAADGGWLRPADVRLVEQVAARAADLAGPAEPPARIHGDCWAGNVLWSGGRGWLVDPAAHGGHRETDLAMLDLFGAPHADRIRAGYTETAPLAAGWPGRIPLHQLHPLLVHVCLFGAGYRAAALDAARAALTIS